MTYAGYSLTNFYPYVSVDRTQVQHSCTNTCLQDSMAVFSKKLYGVRKAIEKASF